VSFVVSKRPKVKRKMNINKKFGKVDSLMISPYPIHPTSIIKRIDLTTLVSLLIHL